MLLALNAGRAGQGRAGEGRGRGEEIGGGEGGVVGEEDVEVVAVRH